MNAHPCCAPSRGTGSVRGHTTTVSASAVSTGRCTPESIGRDFAVIAGGEFQMGARFSRHPEDGETPVRDVKVESFSISKTAVSNAQFREFVAASGYLTTAERQGDSFVFSEFLSDQEEPTKAVQHAPWWRVVQGACWHAPEGPGSDVRQRLTHPVVHVSWNDAKAFCAWSGTRLAEEHEWEFAARGGLARKPFPWGRDLAPAGVHQSNVWQGSFPAENTAADGYAGTAPVDAFAANGYGLFNMTGNVWEWCENWFSRTHKAPDAPASGQHKVMRGGSYLCHISYCARYRTSSRSANSPHSSAGNIGFRVAR